METRNSFTCISEALLSAHLFSVQMEKRKLKSAAKAIELANRLRKLEISKYPDVRRRRYRDAKIRYDLQFQKELIKLERTQPNAHEAMRFHRVFAISTLWPPLHTRQEIDWTIRFFNDPLTSKERRRLEKVLAERQYSWLQK